MNDDQFRKALSRKFATPPAAPRDEWSRILARLPKEGSARWYLSAASSALAILFAVLSVHLVKPPPPTFSAASPVLALDGLDGLEEENFEGQIQ